MTAMTLFFLCHKSDEETGMLSCTASLDLGRVSEMVCDLHVYFGMWLRFRAVVNTA